MILAVFLVLTWEFDVSLGIIGPPVKCHGPVPKISEGKYYFHDNESYLLRVSTSVRMELDLGERSCFQVDILDTASADPNQTQTVALESLFYSVRYKSYQQSYNVRSSYQFGIAELQSYCKCDCPTGASFCTHDYGRKYCSKAEICITRYHAFQNSYGCTNQGPADLCCEVSVKPYKSRRFTAISLVHPRPHTLMEIEIYTLYQEKWSLFRRYVRKILPYKANTLRLNGYENVADMEVRAQGDAPQHQLKNGDKWYFYEETSLENEFLLYDDRRVNGMYEREVNKFGWLRFEKGQWTVGDPMLTLHDLQRPLVVNCKGQRYEDRYDVSAANVVVIRNNTGAINAQPYLGVRVQQKQAFVDKVALTSARFGSEGRDRSLEVSFLSAFAPSLRLEIKLHQKISVIAHMYASYLEDFKAQICLDKNSHRYLNITLIKSYGQFNIEVYRDRAREDVDLVLSLTTNLPFAANYMEILPLPGFVTSSRLVCLSATHKPSNRLCKWSTFVKQPLDWFQLRDAFMKTEGSCPGCNRETSSATAGFLDNLNPKNWFDGINSLSEALAMGLEIGVYLVFLILAVGVWRKCLWPLVRWAACSGSTDTYRLVVKGKPGDNV